jgi:hypothetical protein
MLSPARVATGLGLLAALLDQREVVDVPYFPASVVCQRIVAVERRVLAKPFRQLGIGRELASERDRVRATGRKPLLGSVLAETTRHDQSA